jgi:hypothetical protein
MRQINPSKLSSLGNKEGRKEDMGISNIRDVAVDHFHSVKNF